MIPIKQIKSDIAGPVIYQGAERLERSTDFSWDNSIKKLQINGSLDVKGASTQHNIISSVDGSDDIYAGIGVFNITNSSWKMRINKGGGIQQTSTQDNYFNTSGATTIGDMANSVSKFNVIGNGSHGIVSVVDGTDDIYVGLGILNGLNWKFRVNKSGDTGIGLNVVTARLHVQGIDATSSNYVLKLDNTSANMLSVRNDGNTNINGRVGIGAVSSDEALFITNTNGDNSRIKVVNQLAGGSYITFDNAGTSNLGFVAGVDGTGLGIIGHQGNFDVNFRTNNIVRLTIKANGNILSLPLYSNTTNSGTAGILGIDDTGKFYNTGVNPTTMMGGSGTTNYISKWASTSTLGNSLLFDNGTNVGIGMILPTSKLHVKGVDATSSNYTLKTDSSTGQLLYIRNDGYTTLIDMIIGRGAGLNQYSTVLGVAALMNNTTGNRNTAIGYLALTNNIIGASNTAIGYNSLAANLADFNTAIGSGSLSLNTTGNGNTAIGYDAMSSNTTGTNNIAISANASGQGALASSSTGNYNIAMGYYAAYSQNGVSGTIAIGGAALYSNTAGLYNTAIGYDALRLTFGSGNTALGYNAGRNYTGLNNTFIGYNADMSGNFSNATAIGYNAIVSASNSLILGNGANIGIGTSTPTFKFDLLSTNSNTFRLAATTTFNNSIIESNQYSASLSINAATTGPVGGYNAGLYLNSNGVFRGSFNSESTTSVTTLESAGGYWLWLKNGSAESIALGAGGNYISFLTNSVTNMLIEGSTGNVAIGTSLTPTARLHVKSVNHLSASYAFKIDDDLSNSLFKITNTARTSINNASHNTPLGTDDAIFATQISGYTFQHAANILWLYDNNVKMYNAISSTYGAIGTYTAHDFYIRTNNNDKIKIENSTGYVGINQTTLSAMLHVRGTNALFTHYALKVDNASSVSLFSVANDGSVGINAFGGDTLYSLTIGSKSTGAIRMFNSSFVDILTVTDAGHYNFYSGTRIGVGVAASSNTSLFVQSFNALTTGFGFQVAATGGVSTFFSVRNDGFVTINGTTIGAAKLEINGGTDQGLFATSTGNIAINGVGTGGGSFGVKGQTDTGAALRANVTNAAGLGLEIVNTAAPLSPFDLFKVVGDGRIYALQTYSDTTNSGTTGILGIDNGGKLFNTSINPSAVNTGTIGITIDGAGSVITTGFKQYVVIPYNCVITDWYIIADVVGSIVIDVWKDTSIPTVSNTIAGSEKPTLSSQQNNSDNLLTTWTTTVTAGDIIGFNVDSVSTITKATLVIKIRKT